MPGVVLPSDMLACMLLLGVGRGRGDMRSPLHGKAMREMQERAGVSGDEEQGAGLRKGWGTCRQSLIEDGRD